MLRLDNTPKDADKNYAEFFVHPKPDFSIGNLMRLTDWARLDEMELKTGLEIDNHADVREWLKVALTNDDAMCLLMSSSDMYVEGASKSPSRNGFGVGKTTYASIVYRALGWWEYENHRRCLVWRSNGVWHTPTSLLSAYKKNKDVRQWLFASVYDQQSPVLIIDNWTDQVDVDWLSVLKIPEIMRVIVTYSLERNAKIIVTTNLDKKAFKTSVGGASHNRFDSIIKHIDFNMIEEKRSRQNMWREKTTQ